MQNQSQKVVIVTGSAGRIGSSLITKLGQKYRIVGFELLKAIYASKNEELVPVDISSDESVAQAFTHIRHFYGNKIASVVHLAAYYSFEDLSPKKYDKITVRGTERLLKALQNFEVEQFIFSSTMLVHAPCKPKETIDENWPVAPKWAYPQSKVRTEKIIRENSGKIPTVILRISGVYDNDCHSIPISHQIQRIYEGQLTSKFFSGNMQHGSSFMHMDDLVDAICLAIEKRTSLPKETVLEIGDAQTCSYSYLQRTISKILLGKEMTTYRIPKFLGKIGAWAMCHSPLMRKSFIRPWMIDLADDNYNLNIDKAKKFLGWNPRHTLTTDLPKILARLLEDPESWYRKNGLQMPKNMHHIVMKQIRTKAENEYHDKKAA